MDPGQLMPMQVEAPPAGTGGRRRRRHPWLWALGGLVGTAGVAVLWYSAFSGLDRDPEDWVEKERIFRQAIRELLVGTADEGGALPELPSWPAPLPRAAERIVLCADAQLARGVRFSTAYRAIGYPWGDFPAHLATSADLLVRCLRSADLDLQQLVHLDRVAHPKRYPLHLWSGAAVDKSIDHRRLPNLFAFLGAFLPELPVEAANAEQWAGFQPGDLVFWSTVGGSLPSVAGIVTDRRDETGMPRCITVSPDAPRISDAYPLTKWPLRAHFRVDPDTLLEAFLAEHPRAELLPRPTVVEPPR